MRSPGRSVRLQSARRDSIARSVSGLMSGSFRIRVWNTAAPATRGTICRNSCSIVLSVASTIRPIAARGATPPSSSKGMCCRLTLNACSVAAMSVAYRPATTRISTL